MLRLIFAVARGSTVLANMQIVKLDDEDMGLLMEYSDKLTKEGKLERYVYPPFGVNFGFPDRENDN
jgi:hypothetical protein